MRLLYLSTAYKILLVVILLGFSKSLNSQDLTLENGEYSHQTVIESSLSDVELYSKLNQWFVKSFVDSDNVIELEDEPNKVIMGKGTSKYQYIGGLNLTITSEIKFTIRIESRNERFRVTYSDILLLSKPDPSINYDGITKMEDFFPKYLEKGSQNRREINRRRFDSLEILFDDINDSIIEYTKDSSGEDDW
jgi:hypothetical protein